MVNTKDVFKTHSNIYDDVFLQKQFTELFSKIHKKKSVPESLFNKVIGFYLATSQKERTAIQVFSDEFCEILIRHLFYGKPPGDFFSTKN